MDTETGIRQWFRSRCRRGGRVPRGSQIPAKVGQPDFAIVELMPKFQISTPWSVQLNVYNALDKKYYAGSLGHLHLR